MPTCIYCSSPGPFSDEHVFPHALGGEAGEWLLTDCVCASCNNKFSGLETNFIRRSEVSLARTFQGPPGRTDDQRPDHQEQVPLYAQTYVGREASDLVYEAGIALEGRPYLRPQFIAESATNVQVIAGSQRTMEKLVEKLRAFLAGHLRLTTFNDNGAPEKYKVYSLVNDGSAVSVTGEQPSRRTVGAWLDIGNDFIEQAAGDDRRYTARVFLDNDDRLVFNSPSMEEICNLIYNVARVLDEANSPTTALPGALAAAARPGQIPGGTMYNVRLMTRPRDNARVIAKIALNVVAKVHGAEFAQHAAFKDVKSFILGTGFENVGDELKFVMPGDVKSDPLSCFRIKQDQHMMMLTNGPKGVGLAFVLKLYGHFNYMVRLGPVSQPTSDPILIVNDFNARKLQILSIQEQLRLFRNLW